MSSRSALSSQRHLSPASAVRPAKESDHYGEADQPSQWGQRLAAHVLPPGTPTPALPTPPARHERGAPPPVVRLDVVGIRTFLMCLGHCASPTRPIHRP